jgi:acetyl-CoA carboxylase biotin carboxyl carrier protein
VDLTNDDVADILALLDSLPYDSLDLRTDKFRMTLRRAPAGGWTEESELLARPTEVAPGVSTPAVVNPAPLTIEAPTTSPTLSTTDVTGEGGANADGLVAVLAPLPGTFYRAPRPGAPPFIEVGDAVGGDTVVAIVETMKLMNSVHAGASGRVARIAVENGEFAPLGAVLMLIEPDTRTPITSDAPTPIDPNA